MIPDDPACHCRGGLIKWADLVGVKHVAQRLNQWAEQFKFAGLEGFFKPCPYLQGAADSGSQLSAGIRPGGKL